MMFQSAAVAGVRLVPDMAVAHRRESDDLAEPVDTPGFHPDKQEKNS